MANEVGQRYLSIRRAAASSNAGATAPAAIGDEAAIRGPPSTRCSTYSHVSAPTQFVEAGGFRYAYRRFGTEIGTPLVFLPHFRAGMDHWDPLVTNGLVDMIRFFLLRRSTVGAFS